MEDLVQKTYKVLEQLNITYNRVDHDAIFSTKKYDAELPGPQVKNLLLKSKKTKKFYLVITPEEKEIDLKTLAKELEAKRFSFASEEELFTIFGLKTGMLSPLSLINCSQDAVTLVVDDEIDRHDTIGMHPNINTTTLMIQYEDFERFLTFLGCEPVYANIPAKVWDQEA